MPLIHQIEDIHQLKAAKSAVVTAQSADELVRILRSLH